MQIEGPFEFSEKEKQKQKDFWKIPHEVDYDFYHLYRASVPSLIHLRILHLKTPTPHVHGSYNAYELGSFSLGFPTSDAFGLHDRLAAFGIQSMAPTQVDDIVRADGVPGQYIETIYQGPDFLHIVGIERVGISQLAPCDPVNGIGGPGYSALVVKDAESEIDFFINILGHFTLIDAEWKTAEGSALGTGPDVPYRFTSIYPQNQDQNYVIILQFLDGNEIETSAQCIPPNQGLIMYSFQTSDLNEIVKRCQRNEVSILSKPKHFCDPILGSGTKCLIATPSGFFVEIFQQD